MEDPYKLMCRYCWEHLRRNKIYKRAGKEIRKLLLQHPMRFLAHCPPSTPWHKLPKKSREIATRAASGIGLTFPPLDEVGLNGIEITRKPKITKLVGVEGNYVFIGTESPPNLKGYDLHWRDFRLCIRQDGTPSRKLLMKQIEDALEATLGFQRVGKNGWEDRLSSTGKPLKLPPEGWEESLKKWDRSRLHGEGKALKGEAEKARRRIVSSFPVNTSELVAEFCNQREVGVKIGRAILAQDKAEMIRELVEKFGITTEQVEALLSNPK
jgi:hypothetical protein